ncbi:MAG: 4-hydroxythreonine-4-phosphate dehydrogenase PdxA [Paracoccaceae bacterium]|nr:4-hydroxythreonine-4-phosphate dehydrogenase PdxA [Paracoccaceae bacterium]
MTTPIALTCGDPAGIGPEITLAAWRALGRDLPFFVIGDIGHFRAIADNIGAGDVSVVEIKAPPEAVNAAARGLPVLHHPFPAPARPGRPDKANAAAVVEVIERAVELVRAGQAGALCTNPISKEMLHKGADFAFPGHTEFLAHLAGVDRVVMMLTAPGLRVVPTTIHIALRDVPAALSAELLRDTLTITEDALRRDFGIKHPRIAVAGLNPHAGEGGAMGDEEITLIAPLLDELRASGMNLLGPLPADTMFHADARANHDAAVCMYHDQALAPIKTLDFHNGTNVTLGLPFIRTSPDHGTAFGIAGTGRANHSSLIAALRQAAELAARRGGAS